MKTLLIALLKQWRTRRPGARRGASIVELALLLPLLLFTVFGALTAGMVLERNLSIIQLVRCAGSMYARGADFSVTANQNLLLLGAGGLGITSSGTGVVYLTAVTKAPVGTANAGKLVMTQRYVIGNASFASSRVGTPLASIWPDATKTLPNGEVRDYANQASAVATLPATFAAMTTSDRVYVVETWENSADFGGYTSLFGMGRIYKQAFF